MAEARREKILPGFRVGRLTVTEATDQRKSGYKVWNCACDCGGSIRLDTRALQRGTIRDCGCVTKVPPGAMDLTGRQFGRLIAVSPTKQRRYGGIVWRCECDCGNVSYVSSHQLLSGNTKSCGCMQNPPLKDFIGKRFGQLTVTDYAGKKSGMHRWRCKCDCGRETVVGQTPLQSGRTKSCGCLQKKIVLDNLKLVDGTSVTRLEAMRGRTIRSNTSGYTGVYLDRRSGKWTAQITFRRKTYTLGRFEKIEDAVKARQRGEEMYDDFLNWYHREYDKSEDTKATG